MAKLAKARWEWRTFSAEAVELLAAKLSPIPRGNYKESCDFYVLPCDCGNCSSANVKIRSDGILDVKIMTESRPGGFELWQPSFRCKSPFSGSDVAAVASYLKAPLEARSCTAEQFLKDLNPSCPSLHSCKVLKKRHIYALEGVIMEVGEVSLASGLYKTFCVESESFDMVLKVVQGFELQDVPALSYIEFLKNALCAD